VPRFARLDLLLLLMILIWGTNYTIVKSAFREIDPQAFNALRMLQASLLLLAVMPIARRARWNPDGIFYTSERVTPRDWMALAMLGVVGHCIYQFCFVGGLARTSVANSSLLLAASPIVIAMMTAALGHDRITRLHWAGTLLSLAGIYLVIGRGMHLGADSVTGDLLIGTAVVCWAIYTIAAQPLMRRHSPVGVTAISMACGTAIYVPACVPALLGVHWSEVSARTWVSLVYSASFAICVAYVIWYAAVRELGSARTSVYSNLLPIIAMVTATLWLHEPLGLSKAIGAGAVLAGVALTRIKVRADVRAPAPEP
jgi:drug/metabolite transporter (DMT)-like permease